MENFKILEEKENPLFKRKEIKFTIEAIITPNHSDVEKLISEKFSTSPETVKIKGIHGRFGSKTFTISANIYKSKEDKEDIEPKKKEKAKLEEKPAEEKKEEVKEEPKPEEKPAEEVKEEKSEEKKE